MTTDPRKLVRELRDRSVTVLPPANALYREAADALAAALDERDELVKQLMAATSMKIALDRARLQAENERLRELLIRFRYALDVHDKAILDAALKENHDKQ